MNTYDYLETPLGRMLLVSSEKGLCGAHFVGQKYFPKLDPSWKREKSRASRELEEYFSGRRKKFDLPLAAEGTPFQRAVWREIAKVPFGETITYAELARRAGFPGSARAAGAATGRNPIGVIVPCHRIVGTNGSLTGYAGGLDRKKALLALEGLAPSPSRRRPLRAAAEPARPG
ncbi:MAG TPA: methylated-DNA--[protein]-cysteine S-methyltransferase [Burkholderiales bacterium]|nr:methylated-DNA--[protein]-cysteine S-methyltransferase [Burkholderiales bacterium]